MSLIPSSDGGSRLRWLLFASVVLNLFFVGAAGAVAIRYSGPAPLATITRIDHSMAGRLDHIAAELPPDDARLLRAELRGHVVKIAAAQADLNLAHESVRQALRAEPFDPTAMRTAMARSRAAHDEFDQVLQDTIADAAGKMSVVGRTTLADWRIAHANERALRD